MKYDSSSNSYTKEFKRNAVAVLKRGMKLTDVARRLSISKSTLFCRRLVRGDDGFRRKTTILEGTVN